MFRLSPGHLLGEGPWSTEVIREALRQGKISLQARACRIDGAGVGDGGGDDWRPLEAFPEFHDLVQGTSQRPLPPPLPGLGDGRADAASLGGTGATGSRPVPPLPSMGAQESRVRRPSVSWWAVASVALGFVGFFVVTGLASLGCGWKALRQIRKGQGRWYGKGLAWLGIVLSILTMTVTVTAIVLVRHAMNTGRFPGGGPRPVPVTMTCHQRLLKLGEAVRGYALDHADLLPPAGSWCDSVREYADSDEIFLCPQGGGGGRLSFAFNAAVAGLNMEELPGDLILLYEGEGGSDWNRAGGPELAVDRNGGVWVYRADGNITHMSLEQLKNARWKP